VEYSKNNRGELKMSGEIVVADQPNNNTPSIFSSSAPTLIIEEATDIANQLSDIIKSKKLYKPIGKKNHVFVEGWTTLGALLGVFPYPETSIRLDREDEIAYEATVIVRTLNGMELSKGEAICSSNESNWRNADEYAIKSMATTRATSKALRIPLGWVMVLAGYSATPAEEMMGKGFSQPGRTQQPAPSTEKKLKNKPKSSRPKSSGKPKSSEEYVSEMPPAEKVRNPTPEPDNVQEGQLTGESYWKQLAETNSTLHIVIATLTKNKTPINKKNILETSADLIGEGVIDAESRRSLLTFLQDKNEPD
jgi:hypothetical protein